MIYLLRHGETEWNAQLRKQGLDDSPLTSTGHAQARAYAAVIRQQIIRPDIEQGKVKLYASPLGRTRVTAGYLIDALDMPVSCIQYDPRIIEFNYGEWSGLTNDEIEQQYPGQLQARENDKWRYTVPEGESYADVEIKVDQWINDLPTDKTIIAVTHSVVSRVIRGKYLGLPNQEAGGLEHRQHLIFKLSNNQIETIDVREFMTRVSNGK
jgi:broad specificity phosphatase PhoE